MDTILDRHWGFGVKAEEVAKRGKVLRVTCLFIHCTLHQWCSTWENCQGNSWCNIGCPSSFRVLQKCGFSFLGYRGWTRCSIDVLGKSLKSILTWDSLFCSDESPMYAWLQAASLGLFVSDKRKGLEIRKRVLGNTSSERMLVLLSLHSHDSSLVWLCVEAISTRAKEEVNWEWKPIFCVCVFSWSALGPFSSWLVPGE